MGVLLDGDALVDLDGPGIEAEQATVDALFAAVDECGIDPAVFG